jgi:hypothetical protein
MGQILYKYRDYKSQYRDDYITLNEVHYTFPRLLNDPFDIHPYVLPMTKEEKQKLAELTDENNFSKTEIVNALDIIPYHDLYFAVQSVLSQIYVFCLSKTYKSIQMWAHYADAHKGICYGFDVSEDETCFSPRMDVSYDDLRPQINILDQLGGSAEIKENQIKKAITTKQKQWAYEEEVRCLKRGRLNEQNSNVHFNPKALKEIIFGWITPEEDIIKIVQLCKANNIHVDYYQMVMANTPEFLLERERRDDLKNY